MATKTLPAKAPIMHSIKTQKKPIDMTWISKGMPILLTKSAQKTVSLKMVKSGILSLLRKSKYNIS